jgi:thymidine kinase
MAELVFFTGTMDCGKSTLAAQVNYTHASRGRRGIVFTRNDRAGAGVLSSRLGLEVAATEVTDATDFFALALFENSKTDPLDFFICDESQFYTREQIDQLAHVVDDLSLIHI